ncbi:MAG: hypothetical protein LBI48_02365 [Burkholderiaceae bacterium]|nr:hypothetical protein [Burkholderiaceae bacterium]
MTLCRLPAQLPGLRTLQFSLRAGFAPGVHQGCHKRAGMRNAHAIFLMVIIFLSILTACSNNGFMLQGWRSPTDEELKGAWRNESDNRYTMVKGDFNGDGVIDEARLLVRTDGSGFGIFVRLRQRNHLCEIYQLDETKDPKNILAMGIKNVSPGIYKTACGEKYFDCQKNEFPEIYIKNEAIGYFKFESAKSLFYWDDPSNGFKRIWTSD